MTQQEALDILKLGYNVYLTGPAGSGKTFLINQYIGWLRSHKVGVGITASTGIAATHLNGRTIHSWAGIGIQDVLTDKHLYALLKKENYRSRFAKTAVLIIDEVSMLHAHRLDMVDKVCRAFKKRKLPFGGLQVILSGDFFQLPPVSRNGENDGFVNEARAWHNGDIKICYLTEQYRQQDNGLLKILNNIRLGRVGDDDRRLLASRFNRQIVSDITPTKLYTVNADVDAINNFQLNRLAGKSQTYDMFSQGEADLVATLKKGCLAPEKLILKKGAVVMFVKNNFDKGYVNGTLGKVVDFDDSGYPIVKITGGKKILATPAGWAIEEEEETLAEIFQIPLRLAWAITVHKSQGMSLDQAEIDLTKAFAFGMGYVALSRVRTLFGINLLGLNDMALQVNPAVIELDQELFADSEKTALVLRQMGEQDKSSAQEKFLNKICNG